MDIEERIRQQFTQAVATWISAESTLPEPMERAARLIVERLLEGSKVLACGNGASAAEAQRFSASMLNRFQRERPGLPALTLSTDAATITAIAADYDYDEIFAKQIHAIGHPGDLLLAISIDGNTECINAAVSAAQEREMFVVVLSGGSGGRLAEHLRDQDVEIGVPSEHPPTIQELHVFIIHCLCDLIDLQLLGN